MKQKFNQYKTFIPTIVSGIFILLAMLFDKLHFDISPALYVIAFIIGGATPAIKGMKDTIAEKELNVEFLMILAAIGAMCIGHWEEGAILIFIFALSGAMEDYATDKNRKEIQKLMKFQPEIARLLLPDGSTQEVLVEDLQIGQVLQVLKGEAIPIDGEITEGSSSFAESAITGEPLPKEKSVGDTIYGATINEVAPIQMIVTKDPHDTLVRKIIRMVEDSQNTPSRTAAFIDRLEHTYVNIVLITVGIMLFAPHFLFNWTWSETFYRAMVLLVVASPCALVASVSPATLSAISNAAKNGLLVKGGAHLEKLNNLQAIAFDKTGTLTFGTPQVTVTQLTQDADSELVYQALIVLENFSTHPLATAIVTHFATQTDANNDTTVTDLNDIAGFGITGTYKGHQWMIGKKDLMTGTFEPSLLSASEDAAKTGKSLVYIQQDTKVVGFIGLEDVVRPDAKMLIQQLHALHITPIMITGDNEHTAHVIADSIGITQVIPNALPDQKANIIRDLQNTYTSIGMVGDGINDAPALAHADVGIAMGQGTDIAMEAADMVLIGNDMTKISYAIRLSQKLHSISMFNIVFSLSVIAILISANFLQFLNLPLGVIGHEGSTILVILNGMRLLGFSDKSQTKNN